MTPMSDPLRTFIQSHEEWLVRRLMDWLSIPSISGDPAHAGALERSADWLAEQLRALGVPTVELWADGDRPPAVYAHWPAEAPGAVKVVVYGHHDVVDGGDPGRWRTGPFEPCVDGGRVYGRGAVDDKGQVAFHLLALKAHLEATGRRAPAVDLRLLIEGEEEIGSPGLAELLRAHRDRLACDLVVVSDNGIWSEQTPTVCTGMRGVLRARLSVRTAAGELHSGTYGGAIRNAATELARIVAALHDADGRVAIPGFYDRVVALSDRERELLARLPFEEPAWLAAAGADATYGEAGFSTLERTWARPTAEVTAFGAGEPAGGPRAVIPATAVAQLSFRLVADQRPGEVADALRAWLERVVPPGVAWELDVEEPSIWPCAVPDGHWALDALIAAMRASFDRDVLYTRDGGSGPGATLLRELDAPVLFMGTGQSADGAHAPDESFAVTRLLKGAEAAARLWAELAR